MNCLAEASAGSSGWIIAIIISILSAIIAGLVLANLNSIRSCIEKISGRVDAQDTRIGECEKTMTACKVACTDKYVSREDWVRAEGYTRQELKDVTSVLHRMEGKLDVVNKLPEISAEIAARTTERVIREVNKV